MNAAIVQQEQQARPANKGRFQKGYDPRRHKFTQQECSNGFWAAIDSIIARYPDAIMKDGRHMVCNFMKSRKPERIN